VNRSQEEFAVEDVVSPMDPKIGVPEGGIRTALAQIHGLDQATRVRILSQRDAEAYTSVFDFAVRVRPARDQLIDLILCGAFDALHPNRRALLWGVPTILAYVQGAAGPDALDLRTPEPPLPENIEDFTPQEKAIQERRLLSMDVEGHLMRFERERVRAKGGITTAEARKLRAGDRAIVVGNPIRLRFPPTPSGKRVVFFDLEDETGMLNVTCFDAAYQRDGHAIVCSPYVTLRGEAQDRDGHTAFLASRVFPYRPCLTQVPTPPLPLKVADFLVG
jgi:error-prone DNA polymerase